MKSKTPFAGLSLSIALWQTIRSSSECALNVIPTPFSSYVYYHGEKMQYYGKERLERMFALRTFLDAGLRPHPGFRLPARHVYRHEGKCLRSLAADFCRGGYPRLGKEILSADSRTHCISRNWVP